MGLWSKLFGGKTAEPVKKQPLTGEELVARLQSGQPLKLAAALAGADDDAEEAALWTLLPHTEGALRVEVVERLAGFELDLAKQARLLLAAVVQVPGVSFTAAAVADVCNLADLCRQPGEFNLELRDAAARVVAALCEAFLGQGPADEAMELAELATLVRTWAETLENDPAGAPDLLALHQALQICAQTEEDAQAEEAGWTEALEIALDALLEQVLTRPPRRAETWAELLHAQLQSADPALALEALEAGAVAKIPMRQAVLERVQREPADEGAWSLTQRLRPDAEVLAVLVPLARAALGERWAKEESLCSPASQAGCSSCSGKPGADDESLMVPKALEARLQPVVGATAQFPGEYQDLLTDCLIAPSAALRTLAAAVVMRWPQGAASEELWQAVAALADDSHPQVHAQVKALLARGR